MQTGIIGSQDNGLKWSTLGVRRSKVKFTWSRS